MQIKEKKSNLKNPKAKKAKIDRKTQILTLHYKRAVAFAVHKAYKVMMKTDQDIRNIYNEKAYQKSPADITQALKTTLKHVQNDPKIAKIYENNKQ